MENEMIKYTSGPWSYYTKPQPNGCPIVGAKGLMIAQIAHSINEEWQAKTAIANAQLISAAPELLEALQTLVDNFGPTPSEKVNGLAEARAAIKKAIG
jgi:hypothetical protein